MNVNQRVKRTMLLLPSWFADEISALRYLFFVNGNGYTWKGGQLVKDNDHIPVSVLLDERQKRRQAILPSGAKLKPRMYKPRKMPKEIYPLCEFANIATLPDDIQPDWLDAAERILHHAEHDCLTTERDDEYIKKAKLRIAYLRGRKTNVS